MLEHIILVSTTKLEKATVKDQEQPSESIRVQVDIVDTLGHTDLNKEDTLETRKEKEEQAMQTLVSLPSTSTPIKSHQEPSTIVVSLQISTPVSSQSKFVKVLHYSDPFLDENIIIPHFESTTMTLDDLNKLQVAINRKRQQ